MEQLKAILNLLTQRRAWVAILGIASTVLMVFKVDLGLDTDTLAGLLTNVFVSISGLVAAVLATWSYVKPKK